MRGGLAARLLAIGVAVAAAGGGCGGPTTEEPSTPSVRVSTPVAVPEAESPRDVAVVRVRDQGEIHIELLPEIAPKTVANFVDLAEQGFYDGTTFHRVIPQFAIQGGDPNSRNRDPRDDGRGGPGYTIVDEFSDISHLRGIVSMANQGRPNTAGSQFFIVVQAARPLDGKYTVFGRVIHGMDVVDAISRADRDRYGRRGPRDRPFDDIVIESVRIARGAAGAPALADGGTGPNEPESEGGPPQDS